MGESRRKGEIDTSFRLAITKILTGWSLRGYQNNQEYQSARVNGNPLAPLSGFASNV
jgi:hypothetical protein